MLSEILVFAAKCLLLAGAVLTVLLVAIRAARGRDDAAAPGRLQTQRLNDEVNDLETMLRLPRIAPKERKAWLKRRDKEAEAREAELRPVTWVLDFEGDLDASSVENLREEITAIVAGHREGDDVIVRIESAGGTVHGYGLAASQLARLRARGLRVTACVDRVAASGGYMMACESDEIVAAPFAIVGSIGVVANIPNLHRLLERHGVDYEEMTSGEFKRTVSIFGKIEPDGREKFLQQLAETHDMFKQHVLRNRSGADATLFGTGEHWPAARAVELRLVDRIGTSDDEIVSRLATREVIKVRYERRRTLMDRVHLGRLLRLVMRR